jgi:hypothetical protein
MRLSRMGESAVRYGAEPASRARRWARAIKELANGLLDGLGLPPF